jgi:hypothetical protein
MYIHIHTHTHTNTGSDAINVLPSSADDATSSSYPLSNVDESSVLKDGFGADDPVAGSSISDVLAQYMNKGESGVLSVAGEV